MPVPRAPTSIVLVASYCCIALLLAAVFLVERAPDIDAVFSRLPSGRIAVHTGRKDLLGITEPDAEVTITSAGRSVSLPAAQLLGDYIPQGPDAAPFYAGRAALAEIYASGDVAVLLPGNSDPVEVGPRSREFWQLGFDFWLMLLAGIAGFLVSAWVWALRPANWGARMFAVSGLGLMLSAVSAAIYQAAGPGAGAGLLWWAYAINLLGSQLCGSAQIAQGLTFPRLLVRPRYLLAIPLLTVPLSLATLAGWLTLHVLYIGMLAEFISLILLMLLQWRRARIDPLSRAALRCIALSTALGTTGFVIVNVAPTLMGRPLLGGDGLAFLFLFAIYGGTALGVGRYRLFDLDRWAYRIVLAIAGSLALLAVDALLVVGLKFQPPEALGLSLAFIGLVYLPLRLTLLARFGARASLSPGEVLEAADSVGFSPSPELRRQRWRALLQKLFEPLDMAPAQEAVTGPALRRDGLELLLPAAAGEPALVLRYPAQGRALFSRAQLDLAGQLVLLMERADSAREGYARGVVEERSRIARDLHDDVSGRLLTSLHRPDPSLIREDVRTAMADLRSIMRGLAGEQLPAHQLLANLRHETATRLEAAGITLSWPVDLTPAADPLLDYARYKNFTSAHREVITNILRHAGAGHVEVETACTPELLSLAIGDDGIGRQDSGADAPAGNGLRNIRRRLEEIGGSVTILDRARGTRVELVMPVVKEVAG